MALTAPLPRDPRRPSTTPEEVTAAVEAILSEPADTLKDEAEQLARAHDIVHRALQ